MNKHKGVFHLLLMAALLAFLLTGCDKIPGKPKPEEAYKRPSEITDFAQLYHQNCAACHSLNFETPAASISLNDPVYIAYAGREKMVQITSEGVPGTAMSAFSRDHGGQLTKEQIRIVVNGIMDRSPKLNTPATSLPPYKNTPGNVVAGQKVYRAYCASCHGDDGAGDPKGGSVIDPAYLRLVSDQYLRSVVVAGRAGLGMPNWSQHDSGKIMSDQDIADVVAWLVSHRPKPNAQIDNESQTESPL